MSVFDCSSRRILLYLVAAGFCCCSVHNSSLEVLAGDDLDEDGQFSSSDFDEPNSPVSFFSVPDTGGVIPLPSPIRTMDERGLYRWRSLDLVRVAWWGDSSDANSTGITRIAGGRALSSTFEYFAPDNNAVFSSSLWSVPLDGRTADVRQSAPPNNSFGFIYGMRVMQQGDVDRGSASGGFLGNSFWHRDVEDTIVGPQVGGENMYRRGPLSIRLQGTFTLGIHFSEWEQDVGYFFRLDQPPSPGQRTESFYERVVDLLPVGEFRCETELRITQDWFCQLGWSGLWIGSFLQPTTSPAFYGLGSGDFLANETDTAIFHHGVYCNLVWER